MIDLIIFDDVVMIVLNVFVKFNVFDEVGLDELDVVYDVVEEVGVCVLLFCGEGRVFCVGCDIFFVDFCDDDVFGYLGGVVILLMQWIVCFFVFMFVVVYGVCFGVGFGLFIVMDVVYVVEFVKIGFLFVVFGVIFDLGGYVFFFEWFGLYKMLDFIYMGWFMIGVEVVQFGLFFCVFFDDDVVMMMVDVVVVVVCGVIVVYFVSKEFVFCICDECLILWELIGFENIVQVVLCDIDDYCEGFVVFQEKCCLMFFGY